MSTLDDLEVRLVETPTVSMYVDVQWLNFAQFALRRMRRSRPGLHVMFAAGCVRVYLGVGP